ncbi:hypothetical protein HUJ04_000801 [Dendroctonus ponderosae]|uniref:G-patch domain-containing protein n=1 Tax=Dendroctonus ponderosae TaxID=77166 RepID=A0AAR5PEZ2_DENPD|nr:hypothetical protein HUJ04_000801 [Dendroctonus ponderosae]
MSMLAERRRKQKWSLNPRGKFWAEDSNKFGQKLMEKMGWSSGKGLGAKENGMTEHIKVSYKNDSQGVGYKETDEQWTETQEDFKAVLEALAGENQTTDELKLSSLEQKSEGSKVRVHYKKFTRGKDLSRRTEKDLACIFGKKNLKGTKKSEDVAPKSGGVEDKEDNKQFSNAGLMSDYFKKKLPSFGKVNGYLIGNNGVLKKADDDEQYEKRPAFASSNEQYEEESECEIKPHFGFGFQQTTNENSRCETASFVSSKTSSLKASFVSYISESSKDDDDSIKKKKKNKRALDDSTNIKDTPTKKTKLEPQSSENSVVTKKQKSKKIKDDSGIANPAFDPMYSSVKVEKHVLESIEESTLNDTIAEISETLEVQAQINNEVTPIKLKSDPEKKKKKKKASNLEESPDMQTSVTECEEMETPKRKTRTTVEDIATPEDANSERTEKKKKPKKDSSEENGDRIDVSNQNLETSYSETEVKSRKKDKVKSEFVDALGSQQSASEDNTSKKKKTKKNKDGLDNPLFSIGVENETSVTEEQSAYEIKLKPKKKDKSKENVGVENPTFSCNDSVNSQDLPNEEFEIQRKKKSKKKKRKDTEENKGLDNPALNLEASIDDCCDLMLNVVSTPIQPTESKHASEDLSIQRVRKVERRKSVRFSDVTRERIIPSKEEMQAEGLDCSRDIVEFQGKLNDSSDLTYLDTFVPKKKSKKKAKGLENGAFDQYACNIEETIDSMNENLNNYQAEIENDMNEAKMKSLEIEDIMIGQVGNPDGTDEKLADGTVKLKFKNASFKKRAKFMDSLTGPKKSYTHLIKGDIVVGFKESNLHEIKGYGTV